MRRRKPKKFADVPLEKSELPDDYAFNDQDDEIQIQIEESNTNISEPSAKNRLVGNQTTEKSRFPNAEEKRHKCPLCDYSNLTVRRLSAHIKAMHHITLGQAKALAAGNPSEPNIKTPQDVKEEYSSNQNHPDSSFENSSIEKVRKKSESNGRKRRRSDEKPFQCHLCDCSYFHKESLSRHMKKSHQSLGKKSRLLDQPADSENYFSELPELEQLPTDYNLDTKIEKNSTNTEFQESDDLPLNEVVQSMDTSHVPPKYAIVLEPKLETVDDPIIID